MTEGWEGRRRGFSGVGSEIGAGLSLSLLLLLEELREDIVVVLLVLVLVSTVFWRELVISEFAEIALRQLTFAGGYSYNQYNQNFANPV